MSDDENDDPRALELESLSYIFPEIDRTGPFSFTLNLHPKPEPPLRVRFRSSRVIRTLAFLPPIKLTVSLPEGYPNERAPLAHIQGEGRWLPSETKAEIETEIRKVWNDDGPGEVVYNIIDLLQQLGEEGFRLGKKERNQIWHPANDELAGFLIPYNDKKKKEEFDGGTFDCGICLDPKKGVACYRMVHCGHVFCKDCLVDMYTYAIKTGEINNVHCPDIDCSKPKKNPVHPAQATANSKDDKGKTAQQTNISVKPTLHPSELLSIGITPEQISRYESLKRKLYLDSDPTTSLCPRTWCQGPTKAAISSFEDKRKAGSLGEYFVGDTTSHEPELEADDLALPPLSNLTLTPTPEPTKTGPIVLTINNAPPELLATLSARRRYLRTTSDINLAICSSCDYAFCLRCEATWHGSTKICRSKNHVVTAEELANEKWIEENTKACPTCEAAVVKAHGCNHMTCKCGTHFCFLCGGWVNQSNPYAHWNTGGRECYQRLFEGEEGDGGDRGPRGGRLRRVEDGVVEGREVLGVNAVEGGQGGG